MSDAFRDEIVRPRRRQRTFTEAFGVANLSGDQPGDDRAGGFAMIENGPVGPIREEIDEDYL